MDIHAPPRKGVYTMSEQLLNQLKANLKFIENPDNYFAMFRYVISYCTTAEFANQILHNSEAITDQDYAM